MSFLKELKRRHVFQVSIAYVLVAWVVLQVAALAFQALEIPDNALVWVWVATFVGFPLAMVFAWRYDLTTQGIVRTPLAEGDERRAIDNIMTRLRSMVEETGAGIILVSHLRRVDGNKGHENGIEVSLSHLRGSNSIAQLSDCVIALERNQQSEDELEARTTRLRVLKSRYTGDVGMATALVYDKDTGRLSEHEDTEFTNEKTEDIIPF